MLQSQPQPRAAAEANAFMQLSKLLSDYPGLTTAISVSLLLIALGVVGYQLWARSGTAPQGEPLLQPGDQTHTTQS